jgi:hypothetical protein
LQVQILRNKPNLKPHNVSIVGADGQTDGRTTPYHNNDGRIKTTDVRPKYLVDLMDILT